VHVPVEAVIVTLQVAQFNKTAVVQVPENDAQ